MASYLGALKSGSGGDGSAEAVAGQVHNLSLGQSHSGGALRPAQESHAGEGDTFAEVLFFPDPGMPCRSFIEGRECRRHGCDYVHHPTSLTRLLKHLHGAHHTLDICVFTITCNEIADAIRSASRRGVAVRIISDDDQAASLGSDVQELRKEGIPVRLDHNKNHMHHKFAIIDGRILVNGSFNWTRNAILGNQENVTITHFPALTHQFAEQFNRMWAQFA